ncbi:MAG: hypothetical protein FJW39_34600 [Acidobacteria bacterium]|nr:hypothetical protein [Acidobacteriota bacterium]
MNSTLPRLLALACCGVVCAAPPAPPKTESIFPLGANPGTSFEATIRGSGLKGAYAIWFEKSGASAKMTGVETEAGSGDSRRKPADLLKIEIQVDAGAKGALPFRVLSPGGISNALNLFLHAEPSLRESAEPHDLPKQAQPLASIPAAVQGKIAQVGEVDYYSFRAAADEEITFITTSSEALDPGLALYKPTGSWFDPDRPARLAFTDEPVSYPNLSTEAVLTYRFKEAGEYFIRVNGFWGHGGAGQEYVLRVIRGPAPTHGGDHDAPRWSERNWTRALSTERMRDLSARALPSLAAAAKLVPVVDADAEPTQVPVEPHRIELPAMVTGSIERPGDIDRVRFAVKEGDRIAIEIETPGKTVPLMNPYLRIVDSDGVEAFTNILSFVNSNTNLSKQIHPKTQYTFPRGGEFTLEIRDITAVYGDRQMRYKVLVRPQVPHMGEVKVNLDCLNLEAGKAQKVSIITDQEEGFDGYVIVSMEGLPEGVRAVTATEVDPDSPPQPVMSKRERFVTKNQKATLVLAPDSSAPATRAPVIGRIYAQPVVKGELGTRFLVKEIPIMVVKAAS